MSLFAVICPCVIDIPKMHIHCIFKVINFFLDARSILYDLQKSASKETEISSLTTLIYLISSSQEQIKFLCNSNGIDVIMYLLENDTKLENICLKILANASKRHEKIRFKLLQKNIFHLLAKKLRNEIDISKDNLILYSALSVVLLQGNCEAQNQMRASGCLSSAVYILSRILDEAGRRPLPARSTELIIYTIIASSREPRHTRNQTEVGWITPKVLEYLGKQTRFTDNDQIEIIKCCWFFLKSAIDRNELNQQIFLNSSGFGVLFRSIQDVIEEETCEEMGDLLVRMTGLLVKFKSNTEFLYYASNYCPVMILSSLLTGSNSLIIQHTIFFLDSLTREFPHVIGVLRDNNILRRMKKAKITLKNRIAVELCYNFCNRVKIFGKTQISQRDGSLGLNLQHSFSLGSENGNLSEATTEVDFPQTCSCVVHDADLTTNFPDDSKLSSNSFTTTGAMKNKERIERLNKLTSVAPDLSLRKELRKRRSKLREIISQNHSRSSRNSGNRFNILGGTAGRIRHIFQVFLSFFIGDGTHNPNKRLLPGDSKK